MSQPITNGAPTATPTPNGDQYVSIGQSSIQIEPDAKSGGFKPTVKQYTTDGTVTGLLRVLADEATVILWFNKVFTGREVDEEQLIALKTEVAYRASLASSGRGEN